MDGSKGEPPAAWRFPDGGAGRGFIRQQPLVYCLGSSGEALLPSEHRRWQCAMGRPLGGFEAANHVIPAKAGIHL